MMSVGFGAMDTDFSYKGETYHYPSGIAHFLEHKLFEAAQERMLLYSSVN